jgi:hypothetical protein
VEQFTVTSRCGGYFHAMPSAGVRAPQEDDMSTWENLPILIALPLAVAAALMSGDAPARQEVRSFFAEALAPQAADLGGDPGYLLGMEVETVWPLPGGPASITP